MIAYVVNFNEIAKEYTKKLKQFYTVENGYIGKEYLIKKLPHAPNHYVKKIVLLDRENFTFKFNGEIVAQLNQPMEIEFDVPLDCTKCEAEGAASYFYQMVVLE